MPSRNVVKEDAPYSYYHIYVRGNSYGKIFQDSADYETFIGLFKRYLSAEEAHDRYGISYPNFYNKLELMSYVLMPNHVHLLIYQHQQGAMPAFMRSLLTSYSRYFNGRYQRSGSLFESRYKAALISDNAILPHISRYIHLNPRQWRGHNYSSLQYYLHQSEEMWIRPVRVLKQLPLPQDYEKFMEDNSGHKQMIDILKHELANDINM